MVGSPSVAVPFRVNPFVIVTELLPDTKKLPFTVTPSKVPLACNVVPEATSSVPPVIVPVDVKFPMPLNAITLPALRNEADRFP